MKRRRWLIVAAVVAALVAVGYFAASRPSRLESGFRQIVQKYGMESTDPGGGHYIGEGFSDEKCRKLERDLERLAEETGLIQGEAWREEESAFRQFQDLDKDDRGRTLSFSWQKDTMVGVAMSDDTPTPLQRLRELLRR